MGTQIDVMDSACSPNLADALRQAYRAEAALYGYVVDETDLGVVFDGEDGPWVGGALASEDRRRLAARLATVRRRVEVELLKPFAMPLDLHSDPHFRDVFDREPDAWLVSGGNEEPIEVRSVAERDMEFARRSNERPSVAVKSGSVL